MGVSKSLLLLDHRHELLGLRPQASRDQLDVVFLQGAVVHGDPQEGLHDDVVALDSRMLFCLFMSSLFRDQAAE